MRVLYRYLAAGAALAVTAFASAQGSGFIKPPNLPEPAGAVLSHPRLFLTAQDLPTYRSWAKTSNPIWVSLTGLAAKAKDDMDAGRIEANDSGIGAANYEPFTTEKYAELFAFMSLVDTSAEKRAAWAVRAHDLLMRVINVADLGAAPKGTPFREPNFAIHNRSRWFGEAFPLVVDWCYGTFTLPEKAAIRRVFLRWIQENLTATITGPYDHPEPLGTVNSPKLTKDPVAVRWSSNNYYCNHARQVGMLALALDPLDDVPSGPGEPGPNTLRRFVGNSIGAWLKTVQGCEETFTKGGISPEGIGYGESDTSGIAMLMLALHTSGMDDPSVYGPAAELSKGDFWQHEFEDAYIHSMSPALTVQMSWIGKTHLPADFGDNGLYSAPNYVRTFAPMMLLAKARGDEAHYQKLRWMFTEYEPGQGKARPYQISGLLQSYGPLWGILDYMTLVPHAPTPVDPRPSMPLQFVGTGLNRMLARTDWTKDAAWITTKCAWNMTDHNTTDGNKVEFYRRGEWLTKGRMGYGPSVGASDFQNTLCIQNNVPASTPGFWGTEGARGSQFSYSRKGVPPSLTSFGPEYVYTQGDATPLYNVTASSLKAEDVAHASRSVMWLKPDFIVLYDRARSQTAGKFKRFFLNTENLPLVSGNVATAKTPNGQKLYVTSLLPVGATITPQSLPPDPSGPDAGQTAELEPMRCRLMIERPNPPRSVQFLTVLQGADAKTPVAGATLVQSASGDLFEGAILGDTLVLFKADAQAALKGASISLPGTVKTIYVAGLKPGAACSVTKTTVGSGFTLTLSPGGATVADAGGVIRL